MLDAKVADMYFSRLLSVRNTMVYWMSGLTTSVIKPLCSHICARNRVFFTSCANDHSRIDPLDEQQMMLSR